jgi:hypothetical protein
MIDPKQSKQPRTDRSGTKCRGMGGMTRCQCGRKGVRCRNRGAYIVAWPAMLLVCGTHHAYFKRKLEAAHRKRAQEKKR